RAGYSLTLDGLGPFWLVDRKVVASAGEDAWATKADTLLCSGPFRMTSRTPGQTMDFQPVPGWYGGKTGALTHVHIEVVVDAAAQDTQFESGVFALVGLGRQGLPRASATRYTTDATLKTHLTLVPTGHTFRARLNVRTG